MAETRRVYHPSLNAYQDVPVGDVPEWVEQGWRKTAPAHFDPAIAPPVPEPEKPAAK